MDYDFAKVWIYIWFDLYKNVYAIDIINDENSRFLRSLAPCLHFLSAIGTTMDIWKLLSRAKKHNTRASEINSFILQDLILLGIITVSLANSRCFLF